MSSSFPLVPSHHHLTQSGLELTFLDFASAARTAGKSGLANKEGRQANLIASTVLSINCSGRVCGRAGCPNDAKMACVSPYQKDAMWYSDMHSRCYNIQEYKETMTTTTRNTQNKKDNNNNNINKRRCKMGDLTLSLRASFHFSVLRCHAT